jgi:hypothetical protein
MLTVYTPFVIPTRSSEVAVFDQENAYGNDPPVTVISTAPVAAPKQETFVVVPLTNNGAVGPFRNKLPAAVHPFASTTVTL